MAVYDKEHGLQSILDATLGEYSAKGFELVEPDDHVLELHYHDDVVARFLQAGATIPMVRDACREHLEGLAG